MPISKEQALAALARHEAELDARLRESQARVDELQAQLAEAKAVRAAVIDEALGEGWAQAKIGRSLGMTRQRVAQIRDNA